MSAATRVATQREPHELRLDQLLGRQVLAGNNRRIGRLEEFRAEPIDGGWAIAEYVIGAAGFFERMDVVVKRILGRRIGGYVARWDQLDISDPARPRLTCSIQDLRTL